MTRLQHLSRPVSRRAASLGGLSRQGVIASARWLEARRLPSRSQRILWLLPASVMIGFGVASLAAAELGVAPFDVLLSAIADRSPLSFGQAAWLVSGSLLVVAALLGERINPLGVGFVVLNGFTIDIARHIIVAPESMLTRMGLAVAGALVLAAGVAVVVDRTATGGSFEAIMLAAERRGRRPQRVRTVLEVGFLVAGIVAGGSFGPMTVVIALSMGRAIAVGLRALDDHRVGRRLRLQMT